MPLRTHDLCIHTYQSIIFYLLKCLAPCLDGQSRMLSPRKKVHKVTGELFQLVAVGMAVAFPRSFSLSGFCAVSSPYNGCTPIMVRFSAEQLNYIQRPRPMYKHKHIVAAAASNTCEVPHDTLPHQKRPNTLPRPETALAALPNRSPTPSWIAWLTGRIGVASHTCGHGCGSGSGFKRGCSRSRS